MNFNLPIAEKIVVKYLESVEHPISQRLLNSIRNADAVPNRNHT